MLPSARRAEGLRGSSCPDQDCATGQPAWPFNLRLAFLTPPPALLLSPSRSLNPKGATVGPHAQPSPCDKWRQAFPAFPEAWLWPWHQADCPLGLLEKSLLAVCPVDLAATLPFVLLLGTQAAMGTILGPWDKRWARGAAWPRPSFLALFGNVLMLPAPLGIKQLPWLDKFHLEPSCFLHSNLPACLPATMMCCAMQSPFISAAPIHPSFQTAGSPLPLWLRPDPSLGSVLHLPAGGAALHPYPFTTLSPAHAPLVCSHGYSASWGASGLAFCCSLFSVASELLPKLTMQGETSQP